MRRSVWVAGLQHYRNLQFFRPSDRIIVAATKHSIGRLKRYDRITDPYDGTAAQFNREFNVITGLVNLHLLWDHVRKEAPPGEWKTSVDWERARLTAPVK